MWVKFAVLFVFRTAEAHGFRGQRAVEMDRVVDLVES